MVTSRNTGMLGFNPTLVRLRRHRLADALGDFLGFNPTLVRLRVGRSGVTRVLTEVFQSHAGSIEGVDTDLCRGESFRFQSHAGSIEASFLKASIHLLRQFQSHAGSIEAMEPVRQRIASRLFQSHAGSIEGPFDRLKDRRADSFNPTLVRLRLCGTCKRSMAAHSFNPTLVRLRQAGEEDDEMSLARFQSHAGSIEAKRGGPTRGRPTSVSIPRWFD